jgi:hypothetical protein
VKVAIIAAVIIVLLPAGLASGQTRKRPIQIKVVDQTGAAIAGAKVKIDQGEGRAALFLETDENGSAIANLSPHSHALLVSPPGFRTWIASDQVFPNQIFTVTLELGEVHSPPTVEMDTFALSTEGINLATQISTMELEALTNLPAVAPTNRRPHRRFL